MSHYYLKIKKLILKKINLNDIFHISKLKFFLKNYINKRKRKFISL